MASLDAILMSMERPLSGIRRSRMVDLQTEATPTIGTYPATSGPLGTLLTSQEPVRCVLGTPGPGVAVLTSPVRRAALSAGYIAPSSTDSRLIGAVCVLDRTTEQGTE